MTDRAPTIRRRKPSAVTVFVASAALFLTALGYLGYQLAQGRDPALGASVTVADNPKRPVLKVRRIVKRRVITTVKPAPVVASAPSSTASTSGGSGYSAPATTAAPAPAPAPVAAAPSPAPAPAPAVSASS